jgi:uracil DNA glycosylase
LSKKELIDEEKHFVIVSSHPSGLSNRKPLRQYPAFNDSDCFTKINEYLSEKGKDIIKW